MEAKMERQILVLLKRHNVLTLATVRPDGWPRAARIAHASDGLTLYVMVDKSSQKVNATLDYSKGFGHTDLVKV
jgi:general stress protein 26